MLILLEADLNVIRCVSRAEESVELETYEMNSPLQAELRETTRFQSLEGQPSLPM